MLPSTAVPTLGASNRGTRGLARYFLAQELCACGNGEGTNAKCLRTPANLMPEVQADLMRRQNCHGSRTHIRSVLRLKVPLRSWNISREAHSRLLSPAVSLLLKSHVRTERFRRNTCARD